MSVFIVTIDDDMAIILITIMRMLNATISGQATPFDKSQLSLLPDIILSHGSLSLNSLKARYIRASYKPRWDKMLSYYEVTHWIHVAEDRSAPCHICITVATLHVIKSRSQG